MKKRMLNVFIVALLALIFKLDNTSAVVWFENYDNVRLTSPEKYQVLIQEDSLDEGEIPVFESSNEKVLKIDSNGIVEPIADGVAKVTVKGNNNEEMSKWFLIDIDNSYEKDLIKIEKNLPKELNLSLAEGFFDKIIKPEEDFEYPYGEDATYLEIERLIQEQVNKEDFVIDIFDISDGVATVRPAFSIANYSEEFYEFYIPHNEETKIKLNYRPYVKEDAKAVEKAIKNVKSKYNSYINYNLDTQFIDDLDLLIDLLIESSDLFKDLNLDNVTYYLDARRGSSDPVSPLVAGFLQIGVNGTIYEVASTEVEFQRVLRIPTVTGDKTELEAVKEYFEKYLLKSDEVVTIEKDEEGIYMATISKKKSSGLVASVIDFFVPSVYADEDKVISFAVEQNDEKLENLQKPEIDNPNTGDNLVSTIFITLMSLAIILIITKKLKKAN